MLSRQSVSVPSSRSALAPLPITEALTTEPRQRAESGLSRFASRLEPWLAPLVVALATLATWQLGVWLLERWQLR